MAWTESREGQCEMGMGKSKELLAETKENLEMLCEIVDEMEGDSGSSVGMRRGYRIYQDDDEYGERRRRDSRGRYM